MKQKLVKMTSMLLALSMLVTGCGNQSESTTATTTTASSVTETTTSVTTTEASSATVETTQTTEATETTTETTETTAPEVVIPETSIKITAEALADKLLGGWIGQMVGVAWAASTEFSYKGAIMPESNIEQWKSYKINNAFLQDDLYVEIPFMEAMMTYGALCDPSYIAEAFRDSSFPLWHANLAAQTNLQEGIEYPNSGHYLYNACADDIDWQIECDFLGQMYPGLVNEAALRAYELGHIMTYGDGTYGGVFITAMHAAAYTADSIEEIAEAGIAVIPDNTKFKSVVTEVMSCYQNGLSWEECWQKIEAQWGKDDKCSPDSALNIDAKLNSAYVLIGLLWGNGDFRDTIIISTRCGQDSDCNPSSAASILGTWLGASQIDDEYKGGLEEDTLFRGTEYSFRQAVEMNTQLMNETLEAYGAVLVDGVWYIPETADYTPVPWEQWQSTFNVALAVSDKGEGEIKLTFTPSGNDGETIQKITLDMGDGYVTEQLLETYTYEALGEYVITYTVEGSKGTVITKELKISAQKPFVATPICTVTAPTGGGNKDINVIFDGIVPQAGDGSSAQYDTYDGTSGRASIYVGMTFTKELTITGLVFTEGKHFNDGGWFADVPMVEVYVNGAWTAVKATLDTAYPTGNTLAAHGEDFSTYVFTLESAVVCTGIRIVGKPGGNAGFISIGELNPIFE